MSGYNDWTPGEAFRTEEGLVSWLSDQKRIAQRSNRLTFAQWLEVLAAFHNINDLSFTSDLRLNRVLTNLAESKLGEHAINWILPHARTVAAKYMQNRPIVECIPSTSDEADLQASRAGNQMLLGEWQQQEMDRNRINMAMWLGLVGNAVGVSFMDPNRGNSVFDGVQEGQIVTRLLNPFKVVCEPNRTDISDSRWFFWTERLPIDQVEETYAREYEMRKKVALRISGTDTASSGELNMVNHYLSMVGFPDSFNDTSSDFVDVDIFMHLPSRRYPKGIYAVIAGSKVLVFREYPYPFLNKLPVYHWQEIPCPWRFWAENSSTGVLRAQQTYQKLRRIERDYHLANTNLKTFVQRRTKVKEDDLTSNDNRIVYYSGKNPPTHSVPPTIPSGIYQSMNLSKEERDWVGGASEATHGMMPGGEASGRAILALQAQDETKYSLTAQFNEIQFANWGTNTLRMVKEFYTEDRKYAIVGTGGSHEIFFFNKSSLGNTNDVHCVNGSMLPKTPLAKKEEVRQDYQLGLFGNPGDPETLSRVRRMLDYGQNRQEEDDNSQFRAVAEKENDTMLSMVDQALKQGIIQDQSQASAFSMPVQEFDNHMLHIKTHVRRINSVGVVDQPVKYAVLGAHIKQHFDAYQQQMSPENPEEQGGEQPVNSDGSESGGGSPDNFAKNNTQSGSSSQDYVDFGNDSGPELTDSERAAAQG